MNAIEYHYRAIVKRVIDGDTVDLTVDLGFHIALDIRTRLHGINAPEMNTIEGKHAKTYLQGILPVDQPVTLATYKDPTDKYGRWIASITLPDSREVSTIMTANGYAIEKLY